MLIVTLVIVVFAIWIVLYAVVIRPKLRAYRLTAGISAALNTAEAGSLAKAGLWIKGVKVLILGVITSLIPFAGPLWAQLAGLDWTLFVSSERARIIAALIGVAGVVGPMLMAILHSGALAEASAAEPIVSLPTVKE